MKNYIFYLSTLIGVFFFANTKLLIAQTISAIDNIIDPIAQVEQVLLLSESLEKDTLKNQIRLQPILELAKKKNSIALEWAYYMVMADSYSIGFDQTNATSDQFYNQAAQLLKQNPTPELEMIGNMRQGYYNYVYREVIRAFPFFLKANDLIPQVDINKTPLLTKHFRFAASFFGHIGDQKKRFFSYVKPYLFQNQLHESLLIF